MSMRTFRGRDTKTENAYLSSDEMSTSFVRLWRIYEIIIQTMEINISQ